MKTTITHAWEKDDVSLGAITYAMNRLRGLQRPEDEPSQKAYRRVVENGADFTAADVKTATCYMRELGARAKQQADVHAASDAEFAGVFAADLRASGRNIIDAATQLEAIFQAALEEQQ